MGRVCLERVSGGAVVMVRQRERSLDNSLVTAVMNQPNRLLEHSVSADIARAVQPSGQLVRARELTGGVSSVMALLEIEARDGAIVRVVARQPAGAQWKDGAGASAERELALARALTLCNIPVPHPLLVWDADAEIGPVFVMDFVEGTTTLEPAQLDQALTQMAVVLARLHALELPIPDLPDLPQLEDPIQGLVQLLPTCRSVLGPLAGALEGQVYSPRNGPRLLHGDYWPGNFIWREGRLRAVIDWEDASIGDPLSDLAACRVELLCAYGHDAMELFSQRYQELAGLDDHDLPLWEVYVSVAALASMNDWGLAAEDLAARQTATRAFAEAAVERLQSRSH